MLVCLALTQSAGAMISLFAALAVSFFFRDPHLKGYRALAGVFLALSMATLIFILYSRALTALVQVFQANLKVSHICCH